MLHAEDRIMAFCVLSLVWLYGHALPARRPARRGLSSEPSGFRVIGALVNKYASHASRHTDILNLHTPLIRKIRQLALRDAARKIARPDFAAFEDHFGIRPHEGYGCTNVRRVTVNTIDFRAAFSARSGRSAQHRPPLPGITVKIVDRIPYTCRSG